MLDSTQQKHSLSDYKGKVVFINFWASWCGPCQVELPELNRLASDFKGRKVQVLAIDVDTQRAPARRLLLRLGMAHPSLQVLWDSKSKVVSRYALETMPSSFIIDQKGIIRFTHAGYHSQDPTAWRQEIQSLLHS